MPNKDNIRKWVDALRSGQFKQGNGRLKYKGGYDNGIVRHCCLGVACEVAIANGIELDVDVYPYGGSGSRFVFDGYGGDLPEKVQEWLDVESRDPVLSNFGTATRLNDYMGYDFDDIANSIQSRFLND